MQIDREGIEKLGVRVFFARVNSSSEGILTTTSRALALVGIGDAVSEAEGLVERALDFIHGSYHIRHDIGKLL